MKLTFAFIAATTASFVKFTDPVVSGTDDCILRYETNGQLITEDVAGGNTCDFLPIKANRDAIAAHRNAMTEVIKSISNTVCKHHEDPSILNNVNGAKEHFDWRQDGDHGTAFCKYDCATGYHEEDLVMGGSDSCIECLTQCAPGYKWETDATCSATQKPKCVEDEKFCPETYDGTAHGFGVITPTHRHYGHEQAVTCGAWTRPVGDTKIVCNSQGNWEPFGSCVSKFNNFETVIMEKQNICAGQATARCPLNYVAVGGGIASSRADRGVVPDSYATSIFREARPNGQTEWVCDMGGGDDCGSVTCFAVCVLGTSIELTDVTENYDHHAVNDKGTILSNAHVDATCPAGYQVTGIGMSNGKTNYDASSMFEEFSYEGNGARCNMGASGTVPDFTCFARCAKPVTGATLTCTTVTSESGHEHNTECPVAYNSQDGSGQLAVGAGMKQTKNFADGRYAWFENAQPRAGSKSGVHCDSGHGGIFDANGNYVSDEGQSQCQARCCSYTNPL